MDWLLSLLEYPLVLLSQRLGKRTSETSSSFQGLGISESGEVFNLRPKDLARHAYFLGATGTGKTSTILRLMEADLRDNQSVAIVDLRGDLVKGVLSLAASLDVAPERITLLDLREKTRVQGYNPLSGAGEPYIRALHVLSALEQEAESWGVQLEETLRNALLLLAETQMPLTRLEDVFFDGAARATLLSQTTDDSVVRFWARYDEMSADKQQAWALPVMNKVSSLLAVPTLRAILSRSPSLDLGTILNQEGSVLLISLAVDELHRSSRLLGSLMVSSISREMLARVNTREQDRNPVRLYIDEFENFASSAFESLIAEGRRFGLSLVLSHQTLSQLDTKLRSVIRNNVGVQILYQVGYEDAKTILKELPDDLTLADIRGLKVGEAFVAFRSGKAEKVRFAPPPRPIPESKVSGYRDKVLGGLRPLTKPKAPESLSSDPVDLEDWL